MKTVFLFPGQGAQREGLLHDLPLTEPAVVAVLEEATQILGLPLASIDTAQKLRITENVQLSLLIAGVATARALQARGVLPDYLAGHSIGAFGAAVLSGSLGLADAVRLVRLRGQLMAQAYSVGYGMAAVMGLREVRLLALLNIYNQQHTALYLANANAADQQVVAGPTGSLSTFTEQLLAAGEARNAKMLDVAVPSHCALLDGVATQLQRALVEIPLAEPTIPTIANRTGRLLRTADAIRNDLATNVSHPVRWYDATTLLYELGTRVFMEMKPGTVLTRLAETAFPEAELLPAEDYPLATIAHRWHELQRA
jgi:malonate decarboxylase epsilon subunit